MHRTLWPLAALLFTAGSVLAHEPEPGSLVSLILTDRVRAEISLSDAQAERLAAIRAADEKDPAKAEATIRAQLKPAQHARLRQLMLQARGGSAIADEDVAAELKLSADQKDQVEKVWKNKVIDLQMREKVARFRTPATRAAWLLRNRKEQGDDLIALLSAEQKKAFETMQGKPFDFTSKK